MKERITKVLPFAAIPILLYFSTQLYYFISNSDFKKKPYIPTHILGIFIITLIFIFLVSLIKSIRKTTIILCTFLLVLMIINQIKIGYSQDPVMFSDILMLNDVGSLLDITGSTMTGMLLSMIIPTLIYTGVLVLVIYLSGRTNTDYLTKKIRIIMGVISFALLFVIYYPNNTTTEFMKNYVFDKVTSKDNNHTTTNIAYYQKHGFISGMYGLMLNNRFIEPETYAALSDNLDTIMSDECNSYIDSIPDKDWGNPNIIIIFSESFYDISKIDELKFDVSPTSNFNSLKEKGIYAEMISPSFGGISANVEYEILTGSNIGFFSEGYIPYMQLLNNSSYESAPYFTHVLEDNGYTTQITSTWNDKLFNCGKVYEYMGIDQTKYATDFADDVDKKGKRISEKAVVDEIIDSLESKEKDERIFHMSLTAQTHMPYYLNRYDESEYDVHITDSPLSDSLNEEIQCYAQGVYDADKELYRLYNYIQSFDEPVIIIFYGDHLPYLNNSDGEDAYNELEYFNTDDDLTNTFRKYNTQLLITGNFDLGKDDVNYIGPDLVMPYVISHCSFGAEHPYANYLASTAKTLSAFNCFVAVDDEGNLYYPDDLSDPLKKVYDIRECINWREYINRK